MKALVLHAVGDLRYEEVPRPVPGPNEVLMKVKAAGICGSDIPRVLEKGTYSFPLIPGHEFAGQIVEAGPGADASLVGRKAAVFPLIPCLKCDSCQIGQYAQCENYDYLGSRRNGAFAEYVTVPVPNLVLAPREDVTYEELALCEPTGIAMHAVRLANPDILDTVAVFGCGPIGVLMGLIAKNTRACRVLMVDVDQSKVDFAKQMGFEHAVNSLKLDLPVWIKEQTNGVGVDIALEAAGASASLESCLLATRKFGRVIAVGTPHKAMTLSIPAYEAILRRQLTLTGTWNSVYSNLPKNEWKTVAELISSRAIDVAPLVSHRVHLEDGVAPIEMMAKRQTFFNKVMYVMG
jgi:L-iditol 2-dehydrogenase